MVTGLLMIVMPVAVYLLTLPMSRRMRVGPRITYRVLGGFIVIFGGGFSLYLASYTGDQGGIAAYFFQIAVIVVYSAVSLALVMLNWILSARDSREG